MIFKRNIILFSIFILYLIINMFLSGLFDSKMDRIGDLEAKHKDVNEKYITAQILSQKLDKVYAIFESNLSFSKNDEKNKEASMKFLKELTDIVEKLEMKIDQIIPGKKEKKGKTIRIPYKIQFRSDYEKLGEFITKLENNDRIIEIDELIIRNNLEKTRVNNMDGGDILNQEIEMKIYTVTLNKSKIL